MKITQREGLLFVAMSITHDGITHTIQDLILDTGAAHTIININATELAAEPTTDDFVFMSGIGGQSRMENPCCLAWRRGNVVPLLIHSCTSFNVSRPASRSERPLTRAIESVSIRNPKSSSGANNSRKVLSPFGPEKIVMMGC